MRFYILPFVAAAWATVVPQGGSAVADDLKFEIGVPSGYSAGDIEWSGFEDFDDDQVFTGTIESVISQMRQIKGAHYTPSFVSKAENQALAANHDDHVSTFLVECGGPDANPRRIAQGIDYLNHLPDSARCSNKALHCGRISCSWNSAIWLCNERSDPGTDHQCNMFGGYANSILKYCTINDKNPRVSGKNDDNELMVSVVVKWDDC
ncbi:hypothetical protein F4825DRAFT_460965 [Nemania diffusa]|nr:hypothetical protein F4825DRAFT_460965 [Nemania diffusa]